MLICGKEAEQARQRARRMEKRGSMSGERGWPPRKAWIWALGNKSLLTKGQSWRNTSADCQIEPDLWGPTLLLPWKPALFPPLAGTPFFSLKGWCLLCFLGEKKFLLSSDFVIRLEPIRHLRMESSRKILVSLNIT